MNIKSLINSILFSCLLLCSGYGFAAIEPDSSAVQIRQFSQDNLDSYKAQKQFQYNKVTDVSYASNRWWRDLLNWLEEHIFRHITAEMILVALIAILIIIFVLQVNNVAFNGLFGRNSVSISNNIHSETEDIKQADFDSLIKNALSDKNFRLAVRFHFLKIIQTLGNSGIITLSDEKTNHDYLNEIANKELKKGFEPLIIVFEYVWYGEYEPDMLVYNSLNQGFAVYEKQLGI